MIFAIRISSQNWPKKPIFKWSICWLLSAPCVIISFRARMPLANIKIKCIKMSFHVTNAICSFRAENPWKIINTRTIASWRSGSLTRIWYTSVNLAIKSLKIKKVLRPIGNRQLIVRLISRIPKIWSNKWGLKLWLKIKIWRKCSKITRSWGIKNRLWPKRTRNLSQKFRSFLFSKKIATNYKNSKICLCNSKIFYVIKASHLL